MNIIYQEQADFIAGALRVLNKLGPELPASSGYYLHVELHDEDGNRVGRFSDEIASDAWAYEAVSS